MKQQTFLLQNEVGLHAKPGGMFVAVANRFESKIMVRNKTNDGPFKNGKSMMGVLQLAVQQNHMIEVVVDGEDELRAMEAITNIVEQINQLIH